MRCASGGPPIFQSFRCCKMGGPGSGRYPRLAKNAARNVTAREVDEIRKLRARRADAAGSGAPGVLFGTRWKARQFTEAKKPDNLPWEEFGLNRYERVCAFLEYLTVSSGTKAGSKLRL